VEEKGEKRGGERNKRKRIAIINVSVVKGNRELLLVVATRLAFPLCQS